MINKPAVIYHSSSAAEGGSQWLNQEEILDDPEFKKLVSQKNTISWILTDPGTGAVLRVHQPDRLQQALSGAEDGPKGRQRRSGSPSPWAPSCLSWVFTGIYIFWANSKYDHMVKKSKRR